MKRSGFTLVELLVVVSVISLLMGIVLSTISAVRQQARLTACQANMRQLSTLLHLYNTDNETLPFGLYPVPVSHIPLPIREITTPLDKPGLWWFYCIDVIPDMRSEQKSLLECPAKPLISFLKNYPLYGNYGVNWSLCRSPNINTKDYGEFEGRSLSLDSLKQPGQTLLLADSAYSLIAWQHTLPSNHARALSGGTRSLDNAYIPGAGVNTEREPLSPFPEDAVDAIDGRHPNKRVNVGYADGHVAAEKADDLVVHPLDTEGEFANLHPLWIP